MNEFQTVITVPVVKCLSAGQAVASFIAFLSGRFIHVPVWMVTIPLSIHQEPRRVSIRYSQPLAIITAPLDQREWDSDHVPSDSDQPRLILILAASNYKPQID